MTCGFDQKHRTPEAEEEAAKLGILNEDDYTEALVHIERYFHEPPGSPKADWILELCDRVEAYECFWFPDDGYGP